MDKIVSEKQKNAAAVMVMQRVVEIYSSNQGVTLDEALERFSSSVVYDALFDFETGLWKEGPDYILDLFQREYVSV